MGGWIKTFENNDKEIYECAMCNKTEHTIVVWKKTIPIFFVQEM